MNTPEPPARRFEGKTALVTGAAGGIGSAISARLAAEGAHVVVCDVNAEAADQVVSDLRAAGNSAGAKAFDLTDPAACGVMVDEVMGSRGRIDVLANNAGINRRGDLLSLGTEDWDLSSGVAASTSWSTTRVHGFRQKLTATTHGSKVGRPTMNSTSSPLPTSAAKPSSDSGSGAAALSSTSPAARPTVATTPNTSPTALRRAGCLPSQRE